MHCRSRHRQQGPGVELGNRSRGAFFAFTEVNTKGKTLQTKRNVLGDGCVDTLARSDVEVREVVLVRTC